jgi:hypothetical protein
MRRKKDPRKNEIKGGIKNSGDKMGTASVV